MLVISVILVNLALISYTVPTISEIRRKTLLRWHTIMFFIGFVCDISATFLMYKLAGSILGFGIHNIVGYTALILALLNAILSAIALNIYKVLVNKLYKFSFCVWIIWVAAYILGAFRHA